MFPARTQHHRLSYEFSRTVLTYDLLDPVVVVLDASVDARVVLQSTHAAVADNTRKVQRAFLLIGAGGQNTEVLLSLKNNQRRTLSTY